MTEADPILSSLLTLTRKDQVVEVRIITQDGIGSGYYNNPAKLAQAVKILDSNPQIKGIYITLNEISPALLARRENRIIMRLTKKDATTADHDITRRVWLPIDIDPKRPSGVSSSDEEHAAAFRKADEIAAYLTSLGWPAPLRADSGNGAHLLYRIDLPNDDDSRELIKSCLHTLHLLFSDEVCTVDCANFNAARIWKLYGTTSRKGDNTTERPHRKACLFAGPERLTLVPDSDLHRLGKIFPKEPEKMTKTGKEEPVTDLASWLKSHDLGYVAKPYADGTLYILDQCPFSDAHQDGAYAIQFSSGAIFAGCHHDSCGGGTQRWRDLKRMYDGTIDIEDRLKKLRRDRILDKAVYEGRVPASLSDPGIEEKAERILTTADPIPYMLDTFSQDHEGDRVVAECLIMSLASRSVINSKGLHVSITGESGKGKSHAIDTMMNLVPPEVRLSGRMSDKALFYIKDLQPGMVIALDDVTLSDQMQEILKGVTTSFQRPFTYRTVSKDRNAVTCTIPERCVWWIAKVEGAGDDQVFNRMLTAWIDDSEEQDKRVLSRMLAEAARPPDTRGEDREDVLVVREMWRKLEPAFVLIPYAERIQFQSASNRRNPDMLLDLIKTHAILMQFQRERTIRDGMVCISATHEDFSEAVRLYDALNGETGGQSTKLTRREATLITSIEKLGLVEMTVPELQKITGWASSSLYKLLNGYNSRGNTYSGLLEKCPAISVYERSVTTGEDGRTIHRKTKVYAWDSSLYAAWVKGGAVSLRDEPGDNERDFSDHDPFDPDSDSPLDLDDPYDSNDSSPINESDSHDHGDCRMGSDTLEVSKYTSGQPGHSGHPDQPGTECLNGQDGQDCQERSVSEAVRENEVDFCTSEAGASQSKPADITQNSTYTYVHSSTPLCEAEHTLTQTGSDEHLRPRPYVCGSASAEHTSHNLLNAGENELSEADSERIFSASCRNHASLPISQIRPSDFTRISGWPSKVRCAVCGRAHTVYSCTKSDLKNEEEPVMLCEECYNRAASRHVARLVMLPTLDLHMMKRVDRDLGRCQVCNTFAVAWYDSSAQTGLCESCYARELSRLNKERGVL
ncbi:MAG: hypothetical protein BWY45_01023 [Euryarchaeota archaeon ADurb.Bin294]|nr:MAG: hypothetical protein BWY45_01023 [Euryarchaeota archaeon ADurb.Bin294]